MNEDLDADSTADGEEFNPVLKINQIEKTVCDYISIR
jgi:hypothetical protein